MNFLKSYQIILYLLESLISKKIRGFNNLFRLKLGKYRVLYVVFWDDGIIVVKDIQPRESAYKKF